MTDCLCFRTEASTALYMKLIRCSTHNVRPYHNKGGWGLSLIHILIAGVIRLAFFNVMEEKRQEETDEARKYYQGLPITSIAIILPLFCTLRPLLGHRFLSELHICILTVGLLFIINFPLRKPGWKMLTLLVAIVSCALIKIYFF